MQLIWYNDIIMQLIWYTWYYHAVDMIYMILSCSWYDRIILSCSWYDRIILSCSWYDILDIIIQYCAMCDPYMAAAAWITIVEDLPIFHISRSCFFINFFSWLTRVKTLPALHNIMVQTIIKKTMLDGLLVLAGWTQRDGRYILIAERIILKRNINIRCYMMLLTFAVAIFVQNSTHQIKSSCVWVIFS